MNTISKNLHDTGPGISPEQILVAISDLYHRLRASGGTVATAESCTGGMISTWLTMPAGSSHFFQGGVCTYSNDAKAAMLGVDPSLIAKHGAVSEPVVKAMATGARERFKATWSVGVSGVAGPDGGTVEKPVGTVWCAVAGPAGVEARLLKLTGTRTAIREDAAMQTIRFLMEKIG
jgi:PncC family amidohydrolase